MLRTAKSPEEPSPSSGGGQTRGKGLFTPSLPCVGKYRSAKCLAGRRLIYVYIRSVVVVLVCRPCVCVCVC